MSDIRAEVARGLLAIGAVFLRPEEPFTWASGIKSPIYCDNRLILTAPEVRDMVEAAIAETVRREFPGAEARPRGPERVRAVRGGRPCLRRPAPDQISCVENQNE